jgi:hypothetical protein
MIIGRGTILINLMGATLVNEVNEVNVNSNLNENLMGATLVNEVNEV